MNKTKINNKGWEILISRWLMTWISHTYFRWIYVKNIKKQFFIEKIFIKDPQNQVKIPLNTKQAHMIYKSSNFCEKILLRK